MALPVLAAVVAGPGATWQPTHVGAAGQPIKTWLLCATGAGGIEIWRGITGTPIVAVPRCSSRRSHLPSCNTPGRRSRSYCSRHRTARAGYRRRRHPACRDCWHSRQAQTRRHAAYRWRSHTPRMCSDARRPDVRGQGAGRREHRPVPGAAARRAASLASTGIASRNRTLGDPSSPRFSRHARSVPGPDAQARHTMGEEQNTLLR